MILFPLMAVSMPANTGIFFDQLMAIAAFDFFETSEFLTELSDLLPKLPINEKFDTLGFETVYFINNLGSFSVVLALKVFLVLLYFATYFCISCSMWIG